MHTPEDKDFYTTDAFADYAIERLEEYKKASRPFLLYLPQTAPHYPLHAWPEDIAKYRGKYRIGWDRLGSRRYERQIEMGMFNAQYAMSPRDPGVPSWESLSDKQKDEADLRMAVYAAMIDRMDQAIGRVLDKVRQIGKWKLVSLGDSGWELYDLEQDRTELHNLAAQYPERVQQMASLWETWWKTSRA